MPVLTVVTRSTGHEGRCAEILFDEIIAHAEGEDHGRKTVELQMAMIAISRINST